MIKNTRLGGIDLVDAKTLPFSSLNDTWDACWTYAANKKINLDIAYDSMPIGTVIPWFGHLAGCPALPSGWSLYSTLNSSNRYIRGTSGTNGLTGGVANHAHSTIIPGNIASAGSSTRSIGVSTSVNNVPYSYQIQYIVKVS